MNKLYIAMLLWLLTGCDLKVKYKDPVGDCVRACGKGNVKVAELDKCECRSVVR